METPHDFFISYNSADKDWAVWIAGVPEEAGYSVIVQEWDFLPGSNFVLNMQEALRFSERVIAVLSPDYLAARYPQPEWAAVFASDPEGADRRLIPIMVRSCAPEGLLRQIVQIRIHDLDREAAAQRLLDGVATKRAKPVEPPPFPGNAARARDAADTVPSHGSAPTWSPLPSPPSVLWRGDLDNRLPNTSGYAAVELHLVPVGQQARLQVRELSDLERLLPDHCRRHGIFSPTEAFAAQCDGTRAVVLSTERGKVAGISVTRPGQRSCWVGLPRDLLGAILDEKNLTDQLIVMLEALADLSLPCRTSCASDRSGASHNGVSRIGRAATAPISPDWP